MAERKRKSLGFYAGVFGAAATFCAWAGWPVLGDQIEPWRAIVFSIGCLFGLGGAFSMWRDVLSWTVARLRSRSQRKGEHWVPKRLGDSPPGPFHFADDGKVPSAEEDEPSAKRARSAMRPRKPGAQVVVYDKYGEEHWQAAIVAKEILAGKGSAFTDDPELAAARREAARKRKSSG